MIKCKNIIEHKKMINFDDVTKENVKGHNFGPKLATNSSSSYRMLLIGSQESEKNKFINQFTKSPTRFLVNIREKKGLKHLNDSKASIECSNDINDIYNIEKYNPDKKHKILIVFDDIIADILSNKKPNPIVSELFIRGK